MYIGSLMKNARTVKSNDILIFSNFLADALCELIRIVYDKNYVIFYGNDFVYLFDDKYVLGISNIRSISDVFNFGGIVIYKGNVIVLNGECKYIYEFLKYLKENCISFENNEINRMLDDYIKINYGNAKTRIRKK